MVELTTLLLAIQSQPDAFQGITLSSLMCFVVYATKLKDNILLVQYTNHLPSVPPPTLPQSVSMFLAKVCGIPSNEQIHLCWKLVNNMIWNNEPSYKWLGTASHILYLAQHVCLNANCTRSKQKVLKKAEQ
ncbi:hypothetical protein L208DRAFT_1499124 [Tricholoma matsutake]|nr:hypothetical protein L208DRAFT_1499124 [Tricholoma matsutake 945]